MHMDVHMGTRLKVRNCEMRQLSQVSGPQLTLFFLGCGQMERITIL